MRAFSLNNEAILPEESYPSLTFAMKDKRVEGEVNGIDAIKQAVYKILNTERFEYPIYSFYYGVELNKLIGKEQPYVRAELKRMVTEALMRDDRIKSVSDFSFQFEGDVCLCKFLVGSVEGSTDVRLEVTV